MCSWSRLRRGCPRLRLAPGCRLGAGMTAEEGTRAKNKRRGIRWCAPLCTVACSFLFCHSGLRAGILGGLMRGIVLPLIASPVFHPRQHLPRPRVGARGDGAGAPFVLFCLSPTPLRCHSLARQLGGGSVIRASPPHHVIPASERESWVALCGVLRYRLACYHPCQRLPGFRVKPGMTAQTRRLCFFACRPHPYGVIRLYANRAAVRHSVQAFPLVIPGLTRNPGRLVRGIALYPRALSARPSALSPCHSGLRAGIH